MFRQRGDRFAVCRGGHIALELRNPAIKKRTCLLDQSFIQYRSEVAKSVDLGHQGTEPGALPNGANQVLLAEDMWFSDAQFGKSHPNLPCLSGADPHTRHEYVGIGLSCDHKVSHAFEFQP